ncbi:MAG: IS21 family transposase [Oscillospiraceae bacterium]|nr:IS21 family transposase [Oscillospiraceae bacterium]
MTNYKEVLRLNSLGINNSQIAASLGYSRTTVITVLQKAEENGVDYENANKKTNQEIGRILYPSETNKSGYKIPDYEYVHKEMAKPSMTLEVQWMIYSEECRKNHEIPYQLTQFKKYYRDFVVKTKAVMHIDHKPGDTVEVDWAGQKAYIIDTDIGELIEAHIFVSTLPYSGYSYVEAFLSQNQEAWTAAHVHMYNYFGGSTRILIPDNLKTGIEKNTKTETVVNRIYQEMAQHYDTAVIPARVYRPKDKSSVEGTVGDISHYILAAISNQQFLSLSELNAVIWEKLREFNNKPFQKKDGSRTSMFEEEKLYLQRLPENAYELAEWKIATVQYNYHIGVDKQNYSVPFRYIKCKVDVRLTKNIVEIFFEGERICSHVRLRGRDGQYSTIDEHMPPNHQKYMQWNGERFRKWAAGIGANTLSVIEVFLTTHKVEQQGYKSCMSLLKLAEKYTNERVEAACAKALSYTHCPNYKGISVILSSNQDKLQPIESPKTKTQGFLRGADYFSGVDYFKGGNDDAE